MLTRVPSGGGAVGGATRVLPLGFCEYLSLGTVTQPENLRFAFKCKLYPNFKKMKKKRKLESLFSIWKKFS